MKKKVQCHMHVFKNVRLYYTRLFLKNNCSGTMARSSQSPLDQRNSFGGRVLCRPDVDDRSHLIFVRTYFSDMKLVLHECRLSWRLTCSPSRFPI
jgi:hypothetical protein